jgi:hypothetical protein
VPGSDPGKPVTEPAAPYQNPYHESPGSSTPPPGTTPEEGIHEMWTFFWVAVISVVIIATFGIGAWLYVHGH